MDFEHDHVSGCLLLDDEVIANYTVEDGRYTVVPVASSVAANMPSVTSESLMDAFNQFAHNYRVIVRAKRAAGVGRDDLPRV